MSAAMRISKERALREGHPGAGLVEIPGRPAARGPRRIVAYCHDSVGVGHLRRTLAICRAVGAEYRDCSFLLTTGTPYVNLFESVPRLDSIKLPALSKQGDAYQSKYLGLTLDQILQCRMALLHESVRSFEPDMLLVDKAPLGVCGELVRVLRYLKRSRPGVRTVFGMRDIEDDPSTTIAQWKREGVYDLLAECYDEIWVYGSADVFDVVREYQLPPTIAGKLRHMGYIGRAPCEHGVPAPERPTVLVTVGGGTDGEHVLAAYLEQAAARVAERGWQSVIVGGPDLPGEAATRLAALAAALPHTEWVPIEHCMSCRMKAASLVVCMGGYNTLCELVAQRKPALVVPRTRPRLEQRIRAELWERRGLVRMMRPDLCSGAELAAQLLAAIDAPRSAGPADIDMGGLERVLARFQALYSAGGSA